MKKKDLYKMIVFMFFAFVLLAAAVVYEVYEYTGERKPSDAVESMGSSLTEEGQKESGKDTLGAGEETASGTSDSSETSGKAVANTLDSTEGQSLQDTAGESLESGSVAEEGQAPEMLLTGDIYLSEYVQAKYEKAGINGILSENLLDEIRNADIAMANEEFSFTTRGTPMEKKQYTFRVDPKYVQVFRDMQLDIVTLANNHTMDYGTQALIDSMDTLKASNISYVGAGENLDKAKETRYFMVKNKTIAILGASRVIPVPSWNAGSKKAGLLTTYDPTALLEEITAAKERSDYVVVYIHWGIEKKNQPETYERTLAKQYIDAGADMVVGSHPHVLQGIEFYKNKPIVYSLGNFIFYQSIPQTAVLKAAFLENGEIRLQLLPCKAQDSCTSLVEEEKAREQFYQYMDGLSYGAKFDKEGFVINENVN